jgi:hypothetical protein
MMRDIQDVLSEKEVQLSTVRRQIDALRLVAPLLAEESDTDKKPSESADQVVRKEATTGAIAKWP